MKTVSHETVVSLFSGKYFVNINFPHARKARNPSLHGDYIHTPSIGYHLSTNDLTPQYREFSRMRETIVLLHQSGDQHLLCGTSSQHFSHARNQNPP